MNAFTTVFQSRFFWIFIVFYLLHEAVHAALEIVNHRHVKKQKDYPKFYEGVIQLADFKRSKAYTLEKIRFALTAHLALIPFFWILVFRNGFNAMDYYAAEHAGFGTYSHSVLFCVYVAVYFGIVSLPFKIYSTFVIEEKYGFNRMTFGLFVLDLVKAVFVGSLIGVPFLYLVFWVMKNSGNLWWLWAWVVFTGFQLLITAVYPTFLAPLFNKFKPLENGELREKIEALAKKINFRMSGVYVMDGSRRSGHSNAFFSGMGRFRRIVLFDTLMRQLTTDELVAVLAHEMGHNKENHIRNFLILTSAVSLAGFYVLSLLVQWPSFYSAFNISMPSVHAALILFALSSETFTFMLTPLFNSLLRRHEYQADQFSVMVTGQKAAMKDSLLKLSRENLSNLTPHPVYSFYHYSHPTAAERAEAIDRHQV